jgi:hypothetical protein
MFGRRLADWSTEERDSTMSKDQISQELTDKGFSIESTLTRDNFNGLEGDSVWSVTITRDGQSFQTEYTQGCHFRHHQTRYNEPIEFPFSSSRMTVETVERNKQTIPDRPILADVMCSLVWDSQSVADGQAFEDFADEMGYDTDSREAERIYNGCRDEYFGLIRLCGVLDLDVLSKMFQDY